LTRSASPIGALTFRGSCASTAFAEAARATAGRAAVDAVAMRKFRRLALPAAGLDAFGMTFSRGSDRRARHGSQSPRGLPRFNKSLDSGFREHRRECVKGGRKLLQRTGGDCAGFAAEHRAFGAVHGGFGVYLG